MVKIPPKNYKIEFFSVGDLSKVCDIKMLIPLARNDIFIILSASITVQNCQDNKVGGLFI